MADTVEIPLLRGGVALVDAADAPELLKRRWSSYVSKGNTYARRLVYQKGGGYKALLMHRVILGAKEGQIVDHLNHNGIDNRRSNIFIASGSANSHNRKRENKSGFRGVSKLSDCARWRAEIKNHGKREDLGVFKTPIEAAAAYDAAAIRIYGKHAVTNFGEVHG